jgi:hypothetical protein
VYKSDDYGDTFSLLRTISQTTYGYMNHAAVHPTNQNKVYTVSTNGLYRFDDINQCTAGVKMSDNGGLPAGKIDIAPYISPDGTTMIAAWWRCLPG